MTLRLFLAGAALTGGIFAAAPPAVASSDAEAALTSIVQVTAASRHSCARLTSGQARCWGSNFDGEIGDGTDTSPRPNPVVVRNRLDNGPLTGVAQIDTGDYHSCAALENGQARCWGYNGDGQLGDDTAVEYRFLPTTVLNLGGSGPLTGVVAVSGGQRHTCALLTTSQVRCWGENDVGELGTGTTSDEEGRPQVVLNVAGSAPLSGVTQIDVGNSRTCVRLGNGQARCWGDNLHGALGDGTTNPTTLPVAVANPTDTGPLTGVSQITVGANHGCARLTSGQARCWGRNSDGAIGDGTTGTDRLLPRVVKNPAGTGALGNVTLIRVGDGSTCARLGNGQVRCWGDNSDGQVGDGTSGTDRPLPRVVSNPAGTGPLTGVTALQVALQHTCARVSTGRAHCWGENQYGQVGDGTTGTDRLRPRVVVV